MAYEINELLMNCKVKDFEFFIENIDSYINFTSDEELKRLLSIYKDTKLRRDKRALAYALEREIRYLGSSDGAYAYRKLVKKEEPAGVSIIEIIQDVSKHLKLSYSHSQDPIKCLIHLTEEHTRKGLSSMSYEVRKNFLADMDIPNVVATQLAQTIQSNPDETIKSLYKVLEAPKVKEIIVTFMASILAKYIGEGAAVAIITSIAPRFIATRLATPLVAVGALIAGYNVQTAAMRKTVPIIMYLAHAAIREDTTILRLNKPS